MTFQVTGFKAPVWTPETDNPIQDGGAIIAASVADKVKKSNKLTTGIAQAVEKGQTGNAIIMLAEQTKLNQSINTLKDSSSINNSIIDKGTTKV